MMQDMYGESKLEKLADVSAVPEGTDPMEYMVENSVFVLDQEYAEQYYMGLISEEKQKAITLIIRLFQLNRFEYFRRFPILSRPKIIKCIQPST